MHCFTEQSINCMPVVVQSIMLLIAMFQAYGCTNKTMIPSRYECPPGWNTEYYSYLMAGLHTLKAATQYTCMDKSLEQVPGSGSNTNGKLFFTVKAQCNHFIPCSDKELTCVVCTKQETLSLDKWLYYKHTLCLYTHK